MFKRFSLVFLSLLALSLLVSCKTLYRQFEFSEPKGGYAVASLAIELEHPNLKDPYRKNAQENRRFMVQLWYPSDKQNTEGKTPLPYSSEIEEVLVTLGGELGKGFTYLHEIPTKTYADLPISKAESSYPIVIFSPGNYSTRFQSMEQVQALVSQGYIVLGIDHPYTSTVVKFPDGSAQRVSDRETEPFPLNDQTKTEAELNVRVADVLVSLDTLEKLNSDTASQFYGRFDLNRIAGFGHSLGGGTLLETAAVDSRLKAVFSEEGGVWGTAVKTGLKVPFFYFQASKTLEAKTASQSGIKDDSTNQEAAFRAFKQEFVNSLNSVFSKTTADRYYVMGKGFNHFSFSDAPLYSDYLAGEVPYKKTLEITNAYLLEFMDKYLKDQPSPLLDAKASPYPELEMYKNEMPASLLKEYAYTK